MSLRDGQGVAKDALDRRGGYAALAARGGEELDLMPREPAANGPGIDAKNGGDLADSKMLLHPPSLGHEGLCYLIIANVQSVINILGAFQSASGSWR